MLHVEKEIFELKDDVLWIKSWEDEFQVKAGFTTRVGGVSHAPYANFNQSYTVNDDAKNILTNRKILADKVGIPFERWIFAEQKHTKNVKQVTEIDCSAGVYDFASGIQNTDALYTKDKAITLGAFYADCTPIFLVAPKQQFIGIIHAGWQGTVQEITTNFIKEWKSLGIKPKDVHVVIGPAASGVAYRVGEDVAEKVTQMELEDAREGLIDLGEGQFKLDTPYLNFLQLVNQGVPAEQIVMTSYCTICDADLFFSFRREGETGRMLGFISKI